MNRLLALALLGPILLAFSSKAPAGRTLCHRTPDPRPLGTAAFHALLDSVATGWNSDRADLAASCFTEEAVYLEPPARQLHRGRPALREFFAASIRPARADRMRWHLVAFDSVQQLGFGEYTYRGQQNYHGIVVLQLRGGLIHSWREYQYGSKLSWTDFVGPSH